MELVRSLGRLLVGGSFRFCEWRERFDEFIEETSGRSESRDGLETSSEQQASSFDN